ncbi:MAG: NADPH-dependent FMN reductase [Phycisphaerales bacterium]
MSSCRIIAFAGSSRRDSFNKKLVRIAAEGARSAGAEVTVIDLADFAMPIFDEDLEKASGMPEAARRFKGLLKSHQGMLISSPEYNSSISALLKNAIDWASRPEPGDTPLVAFAEKVAGIMAASPGALGGLRGLVTLRMILSNIQVMVVPDQVAIPNAHEVFDSAGGMKDEKKRAAAEAIGRRVALVTGKLAG